MTRKVDILNREAGQALLQLNQVDGDRLKIRNSELVEVISRRGAIRLAAEISDQVQPGSVYTSFHFAEAPVNLLCIDTWDPQANCPEFKVCAVQVKKI